MISSVLQADNAGSVEITLSSDEDDRGTYNMNWYLPEVVTFNCFGAGCYNLNEIHRANITTSTGLKFNIDTCGQCTSMEACLNDFDLNCIAGEDLFTSSDPCTESNNCGCQDIIMNYTNFSHTYIHGSCYSSNSVQTCTAGQPCNIDCTENSCQGDIIDGRGATVLNVLCAQEYYCEGTFIHCPIGGCDIHCNGSYVCQNAKILYDGIIEDNAVVGITCNGYYGCDNMEIDANYADEVDISCNGRESFTDNVCDVTLNANHANKVTINSYHERASYGDYWNVQYAKQVILNAWGYRAFYDCDLHAEYAGSVIIYASSDFGQQATSLMYWYLPENTTFNCYGAGCYNLGTIQRGNNTDSTGLQINIETCDEYFTLEDSLYLF